MKTFCAATLVLVSSAAAASDLPTVRQLTREMTPMYANIIENGFLDIYGYDRKKVFGIIDSYAHDYTAATTLGVFFEWCAHRIVDDYDGQDQDRFMTEQMAMNVLFYFWIDEELKEKTASARDAAFYRAKATHVVDQVKDDGYYVNAFDIKMCEDLTLYAIEQGKK